MSVYRIRTVRTASGATAVQVVWYEKDTTKIAKHIGSAKNEGELKILRSAAKQYIREHDPQRSFFDEPTDSDLIVSFKRIEATAASHCFARDIFLHLAKQCNLDAFDALYLDLAIMRIIEPCSKLRSLELIDRYFNISYTRYVYECLPELLNKQSCIEKAAIKTAKSSFLKIVSDKLTKQDGATLRVSYSDENDDVICAYSEARYKKDKREMQKQIEKAKALIARKEAGRRAKFIKKENATYLFDEALKQKTELLLGIKGYCTNIPKKILSDEQIVLHYHSLWHVEQAFRMSKSDLRARPIFHHSHDAIRAHVLICFMALMIGKLIEIKTGHSLRRVRDLLWQVQEIHLRDPISGQERIALTPMPDGLEQILDTLGVKNTY